jgi:hypothetical protein
MPDELRSPIKHHLVLHRIDPEQGIALQPHAFGKTYLETARANSEGDPTFS